MEELSGILEKVIFKSPESGFSVFLLKVASKESVTAKGTLPDLHQGEQLFLKGTWEFHTKFGRQFNAAECTKKLPEDVNGIQKYLGSGLIKGIGPKFAEKLVAAFGARTLEIIDKEPHRLSRVEGVGPKRIETITQAWQDQKEISRVMVYLQGKGVSTGFAVKIYKTYGQQSIEKIEQNPYQLSEDIWGIGFKTADELALKIGLDRHSIARMRAGILHGITEQIGNGHVYAELDDLKVLVTELLELEADRAPALIKQAMTDLYNQGKIKLLTHNGKHYITLPTYYWAEKGIAQKIDYLKKLPALSQFDFTEIYQQLRLEDAKGMMLNEDQQRGILSCLQNKVSIITGGPGTGKTTLVKRLLETLEANHVKFKLAAPTGRAAKRMFEGTGRHTETLHRLLEFSPGTMNFTRNEQNALETEFLIIDEASMIDLFLMYAVLKAMPAKAHILLLGDVDQLPSVGAGNVLNDLIASDKVTTIRLTQIFRQAADSMIIVNAHNINHGKFPERPHEGAKHDFVYIKTEEPEEVFTLLRDIYTKKLPKFGIRAEDSVVLVPMNRGTVGTSRLNQELQMILNPDAPANEQVTRFGQVYKKGDRVMQIKNNYDKFVFNGDMGIIESIDPVDQKMMITFGTVTHEYDFSELNELTLSYAVSIHKSQGSEFGAVIIPIFMQHFMLLQRNLIYTAVTRAKRLCILIGQPRAIAMAIKNDKATVRQTFLKEYLTTDLSAR